MGGSAGRPSRRGAPRPPRLRAPAIAAGLVAAVLPLAACRFEEEPLTAGQAPEAAESELVGVTEAGLAIGNADVDVDVAGIAEELESTRAFVLEQATGARRELDLAGAIASKAIDVVANGLVVGSVTAADGTTTPVAWDLNRSERRELPTGSYRRATPVAANTRRSIVGNGILDDSDVAVLWDAEGDLETLAPLSRFITASRATDINDDDVVVGELAGTTCCGRTGFVWSRSQGLRRLPTLGGSETHDETQAEAVATGINDRGDIVGWVTDATGRHPARWDAESLRLELVPDLGAGGELTEVNDEGIALGYSRPAPTAPPELYCVNLRSGRRATLGGTEAGVRGLADDGTVTGTDDGKPARWDTGRCRL